MGKIVVVRFFFVGIYNKCLQVTFSKCCCFISLKIIFNLTNSADPDEMQLFMAFIWVFTVCQSTVFVKWLNIHVKYPL